MRRPINTLSVFHIVDSIAERLENIELRPDQPPPSGGMILQQRPPYMTMDNEVQYIPASINGLKPYTFNPGNVTSDVNPGIKLNCGPLSQEASRIHSQNSI